MWQWTNGKVTKWSSLWGPWNNQTGRNASGRATQFHNRSRVQYGQKVIVTMWGSLGGPCGGPWWMGVSKKHRNFFMFKYWGPPILENDKNALSGPLGLKRAHHHPKRLRNDRVTTWESAGESPGTPWGPQTLEIP